MAACLGERGRLLSAMTEASSDVTLSRATSTVLSFARRLPSSLNHSPAGRIAFTASYTVQKKRSRMKRASLICSGVSTGRGSSTSVMAFSFSYSLFSATARMMPSQRRFPLEKGTLTLTPGTACSRISSGIR